MVTSIAALVTVLGAASAAPGALVASETAAAVVVPRLRSEPVVDCRLQDDGWAEAASLDGFHETHPGDNAPPSRRTAVRLGYTPRALYFAVHAYDEPERVRATLAKRDAIGDDDVISVYLDTFHDRRRAYLFMVNPLGVQQDGVMVEESEPDLSVDLLFESRGCLTEDGYTVELAIPFESLRYETGAGRTWGLHVVRRIQHLDQEHSWMPLTRDRLGVDRTSTREVRARFLRQAGAITGLDGLRAARLIEVIPVATLARPARADVGFTARAVITPSLSADLAVNPDFAEVEADQPQITANQRFPLYFEERRPFFLEGADLLRTPLQVFHSRAIVDPVAAIKATGTAGRTSATLLMAADAAPGHLSTEEAEDPVFARSAARYVDREAIVGGVRVRRDVGESSSIGFLGTTYAFVDHHNHTIAMDTRVSLGRRVVWTAQAAGSVSRLKFFDPETGQSVLRPGRGLGYFTQLAFTTPRIGLQMGGEGYSPDYRAALGYTQRTDMNRWSGFLRYNAPPRSEGALVSWSALNTLLAQFDWRGRMQYAYAYPRLVFRLKRQTSVVLSGYQDYIRVFEEEFGAARTATRPGAFFGPEAERSTAYHGLTIEATTSPSRTVSLRLMYDRARNAMDFDLGALPRFPRVSPPALADPEAPLDPGPGRTQYGLASVTFQPSEALRLTTAYERTLLRRNDTGRVAHDQHLASLRGQLAFSAFTSLRARADYDSLDGRVFVQVLFAWAPRPGTALHLGYDETGAWDGFDPLTAARQSGYWRRGRTFFAKVSWGQRLRLGRRGEV